MKFSFAFLSMFRFGPISEHLHNGQKSIFHSSQLMAKSQSSLEEKSNPFPNKEAWQNHFDRELHLLNVINDIGIYKGWSKQDEWFIMDDDKKVIPARSIEEGQKFFDNKPGRSVAHNFVNDLSVSTMFLGRDHRFGGVAGDKPLLFETMVFSHQATTYGLYQERCCTYEEAVEMHARICDQIRNGTLKEVKDYARQDPVTLEEISKLIEKIEENEILIKDLEDKMESKLIDVSIDE